MTRTVLAAALLCVLMTVQSHACDVMRPCYANGRPLYDSAVAQDSFSDRAAIRHRARHETHRRVPEGLSRLMAESAGRVVNHPAGCPARAFCGCGASVERFGRSIRSLWLAANWLRFPRATPAPGRAAVRPDGHHVVILREHIRGSTWMVYDANSGRHLTRIHPRSIAGFVVVDPRA